MSAFNIGALPVCSGGRIVGIVSDRDIIVRSLARGGAPDEDRVADAMTRKVAWCFDDASIDEALEKMGTGQIQRLIVVNRSWSAPSR
jgi:CBS domain-containing protein